jgi:hypothetical protein
VLPTSIKYVIVISPVQNGLGYCLLFCFLVFVFCLFFALYCFVFVCLFVCLFVFVVVVVYVSSFLDCPLLIVPSVFSNAYLISPLTI